MDAEINRILALLPDAIEAPERWANVLEQITRAARVDHAFIAARDGAGQLILDDAPWESPFVHGYEGEHGIKPYLDHYRDFDDWDRFERGRYAQAPLLLSQQAGHCLVARSEFWEWLQPLSITENAFAKLFDFADGWAGINLHFDQKACEGSDVVRVLESIQRPLGTSLKLQQAGLAAPCHWEQQLSGSEFARLVLHADGRICEMGAKADALIKSEPNLMRANGRLVFKNSQVQNRFRARLEAAAATRLPHVHVVPQELFGTCFTIVITPLVQSRSALLTPETLLVLTLLDHEAHAPMIQPFAAAHGFGQTATKVLEAVYQGKGARQISGELGLSHSYVRELLSKQIYATLGVSDMQELTALLGRLHRAAI